MCFPPLVGSTWGCSFSAGDIVAELRADHLSEVWPGENLLIGLRPLHTWWIPLAHESRSSQQTSDGPAASSHWLCNSISDICQLLSSNTMLLLFFFIAFVLQRVLNFNHKVMNFGLEATGERWDVMKRLTDTWYSPVYIFNPYEGNCLFPYGISSLFKERKHFYCEM